MYLYIELWKAKEAWLKLTTRERQEKIDGLLAEAKKNPITGVVPFSFKQVGEITLFDGVTEQPVVIDPRVARPTGFKYAAAWMVPTRELINKFEERVENLGWWFTYFEQENAWGVMDVKTTVGTMINEGAADYGTPPPKSGTLMGRFLQTESDVQQMSKNLADVKKRLDDILDELQKAGK